jgi:hypothetical protein
LEQHWRQVEVPGICERMIGFSIPQDDKVLVVSYEGTHLLHLTNPVTVEHDDEYAEYDIYDPSTGNCLYKGKKWKIIGLYPGQPLLESLYGERLQLDALRECIAVVKGDEELWSSPFENFSGDWVAVTFSPDGRFIVLGCPYDFDFRVWERCNANI